MLTRLNNSPSFILPTACVAIVTAILFLGLWPLGYRVPNKAKLIEGKRAIRFEEVNRRYKLDAGGVAYTRSFLETAAAGSIL